MIERPHINEMIVVEGKSDTQNLVRAVVADTIETGGSAVNGDAIKRAQYAAKTRGVIILTDPDFNGQRIRQIMTTAVPLAKQAYITQSEGRAQKDNWHKSLGVEHADQQFLIQSGLLNGQDARKRREIVGESLHIGYTNGKQLLKRVQQFGITQAQILTVLKGK